MSSIVIFIGSFGLTGFFPFVPATFASLVFAVLYLLPNGDAIAHPFVFAGTLVVSIPIASWMERRFGKDARCIVIDEIVGMQIVLLLATPKLGGVLLAFLFFRIFDVVKPFPAGRAQRFPGGYGVVFDDVFAAMYARLSMVVAAHFFPVLGEFF